MANDWPGSDVAVDGRRAGSGASGSEEAVLVAWIERIQWIVRWLVQQPRVVRIFGRIIQQSWFVRIVRRLVQQSRIIGIFGFVRFQWWPQASQEVA
ncbi:MAG: hypothetical protein Fues2KO_22900 [Fuerstiella sp.]